MAAKKIFQNLPKSFEDTEYICARILPGVWTVTLFGPIRPLVLSRFSPQRRNGAWAATFSAALTWNNKRLLDNSLNTINSSKVSLLFDLCNFRHFRTIRRCDGRLFSEFRWQFYCSTLNINFSEHHKCWRLFVCLSRILFPPAICKS